MRGRTQIQSLVVGLALAAGSLGISASAGAADMALQLAQAADQATLSREGQPLFVRNCGPCHGNNGEGGAGPKLVGHSFLASTPSFVAQILNGFEERGMPPFKAALNDRQVAALATYARNAWGNAFGVVTPDEVKSIRQ